MCRDNREGEIDMAAHSARTPRPSDQGNLHANIGERAMAILTEEYHTRNLRGHRCTKSQIVEEAILRMLDGMGDQPDGHMGYRQDQEKHIG